jgi:uncharacterized protein (TIGR02145 family)
MERKMQLSFILSLVLVSSFTAHSQTIPDSSLYFGQTPPGDSAEIFAPDIISLPDRCEYGIAFSPDGNECYINCSIGDSSKIYYTKRVNNTWTKQTESQFSVNQNVSLCSLSADGNKLYFEKDNDIWKVERTIGGWGEPQRLPLPINSNSTDGFYTETADSVVYIHSNRPGGFGDYDIWRIRHLSDQAENIGPIINSTSIEATPCIAPDGSYLIFAQNGNYMHLFISFNKGNDEWTIPLDMNRSGADINILGQNSPTLSPDGKYLFFNRHDQPASGNIADIFWVSTNIIDTLKKIAFAPKLKRQIPNMNIKTDSVLNYVIPDNTFSCEYGTDSLKYAATLSNGSTLPSWLHFDSDTRTLSGTPTQTEIDTIKITATNRDTVSAICSFRITVTASTGQETVTDIDGNVYQTVTIGTQVWMKENLKATRYRNGDTIGTTYPPTRKYANVSTSKYQWAYNGNDSLAAIYGRLYTWYAATDSRNVCPTCWHVPTITEWRTLIGFLGGNAVAHAKLKETGTTHWKSPNADATNESGFSGLPGGTRWGDTVFIDMGTHGHYWSSSASDNFWVWRLLLYYDTFDDNMFLGTTAKDNAWAVRCIKDATTGVDDSKNRKQIPEEMTLHQNYPNPFNPTTVISYQLPVSSNVKLSIFNALGQKIKTLVNVFQNAGEHSLVWDATDDRSNSVSSGVYFYSLQTDEMTLQKKMMLVR